MGKISRYPADDELADTDVIPVVSNGATKKVTVADLVGGSAADGAIAAIVEDETSDTAVALTAQFAPVLGDLEAARDDDGIQYIAHRGGMALYPEETLEAYRAIVANGAKIIEVDAHLLADGSLGIMHDTTLTRTTTSTGNVADQTAGSWQALVCDVGATLGGAYTALTFPVPFLDDVLREFGNKVGIAIEAKSTGTGAAIVEALQRHGIRPTTVTVASFYLVELIAARDAGYATEFLGTGETAATLAAANIPRIAIAVASVVGSAPAYLAEDIEVGVYTVNSHVDRDVALGAGATFIYSDDPTYVGDTHLRRATDPFASNTWTPGMVATGTLGRGSYAADRFRTANAGGTDISGAFQGWANPIATPRDFQIDFTVCFVSASADTQWFCLDLVNTDKAFPSIGTFAAGSTGYRFLARKNGNVAIYSCSAVPAATLLGIAAGTVTTISDGGTATYRVTISATHVRFERIDVPNAIEFANTTYTDAKYLSLGADRAVVEFYDVTVS